jgi:uncharacterized protein YndB with AHSA1/START domain
VLWQYFIDPEKRLQWHGDGAVAETNEPNEQGRLGVGAASHCDHGSMAALHRYVDWRPFSYFTTELTPTKGPSLFRLPALETTEFVPEANGWTTTHYRLRLMDRGWFSRLKLRLLVAPFFRRGMARSVELLHSLLEDRDAQAAEAS